VNSNVSAPAHTNSFKRDSAISEKKLLLNPNNIYKDIFILIVCDLKWYFCSKTNMPPLYGCSHFRRTLLVYTTNKSQRFVSVECRRHNPYPITCFPQIYVNLYTELLAMSYSMSCVQWQYIFSSLIKCWERGLRIMLTCSEFIAST
jgi:hypothetical protein